MKQPLQAQPFTKKNIELSLSEGLSQFSSKDFEIGAPQSSTPLPERMRLEFGNQHELRLNVITTRRFGVEGFYTHQSTNVLFEQRTDQGQQLTIPVGVDHFGASLLYYPLGTKDPKAWWPFLQVGGGAMIFRPTSDGKKIATDPLQGNLTDFFESSRSAITAGAGVKRTLGHSLGLRFDAGVTVAKAPTFGLPFDSDSPNASVLPINSRMTNFHASVGIILYLWR
jgi:hypothetical protein